MNKKDYKGYELIKAIHDGEIEDCTTIEVHDLSTLDHIKARITYSNKRLNWIEGDFDTTCLFDDNIYFRVLEDNTEEIEELPTKLVYGSAINGNPEYQVTQKEIVDKINELVKAEKKIRKDLNK